MKAICLSAPKYTLIPLTGFRCLAKIVSHMPTTFKRKWKEKQMEQFLYDEIMYRLLESTMYWQWQWKNWKHLYYSMCCPSEASYLRRWELEFLTTGPNGGHNTIKQQGDAAGGANISKCLPAVPSRQSEWNELPVTITATFFSVGICLIKTTSCTSCFLFDTLWCLLKS